MDNQMSENPEIFIPIPIQLLQIAEKITFSLYIQVGNLEFPKYVLYKGIGIIFSSVLKDRLIENEINYLYTKKDEKLNYIKYISKHLDKILNNKDITSDIKNLLIYDVSTSIIAHYLKNPFSYETIEIILELNRNIVHYISSNQFIIRDLIKIFSYDYYINTHSVNTSFLGISLARNIGITNNEDLKLISLGLLLHDVGKTQIPEEIVEKKGRLNSVEMREMKQHTMFGNSILEKENVSLISREIVLYHHEKIDGSGYPDGLKNKEIHLFWRIACIVDIFDALTTQRSYKDALMSFPALKLLKEEFHGKIDDKIFKSLVMLLAGN